MSSQDLEQLKRARDEMFSNMSNPQPMPHPEHVSQSQDDDKNPDLINSILKNYNNDGSSSGSPQPNEQQQQQQRPITQTVRKIEEPMMDLRDVETLEETAEEYETFENKHSMNIVEEVKKSGFTLLAILLLFNPLVDKYLVRYVKKFIFSDNGSLNWYGYVAKSVLIVALLFVLNNFVL
jgi:hypothetical protein